MVSRITSKKLSDFELWALLDATSFAIYRLRQLELARLGMTIEQAILLRLIHSTANGATVRWIKDNTLRQQNTISITINRMVKLGLVAKEQRLGEKEFRIVCLPKGISLLESVPTSSLDTVFATLNDEEKQKFFYLICLVLEKARSMLVSDTPPFMRNNENGIPPETINRQVDDDSHLSSYRLWMYLNTVRFTISRLRRLELARFGLTLEQSTILKVMVDSGLPVISRDLENATLRQHHSISTLVNRMMRVNLVSREKIPGEKRYRISITDTGKLLLDQVTTAAIEMTFSVLNERDKRQLAACLNSLYAVARNLLGLPLI